MKSVFNIAAYRFVALTDLPDWRERIHAQAQTHALKGTVLLAGEGINLVLAGAPAALQSFMAWLTAQPAFVDLPVKASWSDTVPFGRLIVKVKPEIIRMNRPSIRPQTERAPTVDAKTLDRWLDAGRDDAGRRVALLDTRNAFEVDHGSFAGAHDWRLDRFGDFPHALQAHRAEFEGATVVTYCTGGIRCEKAALLMLEVGIPNVFQLDGGILNYFEKSGGRHFEGNCFVFDARESLDDTLAPARPL